MVSLSIGIDNLPVHQVSGCQNFSNRITGREVFDQPTHTLKISKRTKNIPLVFEASGDHYEEIGDKVYTRHITVSKLNTNFNNDGLGNEYTLCPVQLQTSISTYMQAAIFVICQGAGLMIIETQRNIVERRCYMTARGLIDTLSGKLFYICIPNLTGTCNILQKCMTAASRSPGLTFSIHARDEMQYILKD